MKDAILHGECLLHKSELPSDAKKLKTSGDYHIIAPSEISGNHHVIDLKDGVEFYEHEGTLFMKNTVLTEVRCVVKDRHDNITLEPSVWEIDKQREYDYFTLSHRAVAD